MADAPAPPTGALRPVALGEPGHVVLADLSGTWRATATDDETRRGIADPGTDDTGWVPVPVPGHWRSVPAFADHDGPLALRTRLALPALDTLAADTLAADTLAARAWLVLEGCFYTSDVWFDGAYLGDTEGYFAPHAFEVTEWLRTGGDHTVAVEVSCSPQRDRTAKRNLTGVFQHWDCLDPDWNPGGLWRPVTLRASGPVALTRRRVVCTAADRRRATLAVDVELDTVEPCTVDVVTTVRGPAGVLVEQRASHPLATGRNTVAWSVDVDDPPLWWPWALGEPTLVDVDVAVIVDGAVSDRAEARTGLRSVTWKGWRAFVNGESLFLKGTNLGPTRMAIAEATAAEVRRDVQLARDAGLDLVRVHAHIAPPELYRAADELGMLVWQDLPLQWGYARTVGAQAAAQAAAAVDLLGHHPSLALWCAHNEPVAVDVPPEPGPPPARTVARFIAGQQLPTWNRTILDRRLRRTLKGADPSRRVRRSSGVLPHLPALDAGDSHLYFGWYWGDERDLPDTARRMPSLVRFVSEFGAQAVPTEAGFCEPQRWPDLDWERLARTHHLQRWVFDRVVPPAAYATFEQWRDATQAYQARLLRHHIETLRRLKYTPTGGFCQFLFADNHPGVTWSVLDHERRPKAGWDALVEACRPVIVVADRLPGRLTPGQAVALDVHVVSDLRHRLDDVVVTARLRWSGGGEADGHDWRWTGSVDADSCTRVGMVRFVAPDRPGPVRLDLELVAGETAATNRDESQVVADAG
jgi:beta-mannosidase